MAIYTDAPFSMLNVGDNLFSGTMPSFHTLRGTRHRLTDKFTELWLQGNPWDGGPCVALCGANTGPMDAAKRASSKKWAAKCLAEDADAYDDLPATGFTVDALGRCTYKSAKCGGGQRYVTRRTVVDPDCTRCPINTYHDGVAGATDCKCRSNSQCGTAAGGDWCYIEGADDCPDSKYYEGSYWSVLACNQDAGHVETECKPQITCSAGEKIVGDEQDLRTVKRECEPCTTGKYQSASNHRSTVCLEQTTCGAGQEIDADSQTVRRKCTTCLAGKYQTATDHQHEACEDQPQCKRGESFKNTVAKRRQCTPCPANTYQDSADAAALQAVCIAQPVCAQGQKITGTDSRIDRRTCAACKPGEYQDEERHRETECKEQPACNVGEEFGIDTSKRRQCIPCGPNEYQDQNSADEDLLQAVCTAQPTCRRGEFIDEDSKTARRKCAACKAGTYQDKEDHREAACMKQPVCGPGQKFANTITSKRQCSSCGANEYQDANNNNALEAVCIAQPTCAPGQFISRDSATSRRTCTVCPKDTYQNENFHREVRCKPQPKCGKGETFTTSFTTERTCGSCKANQYQSSSDSFTLEAVCTAQPYCAAGQYISGDSKIAKRTCSSCLDNTYQSQTEHREEACTAQPKCQPGTFYRATKFAERVCEACAVGKFQDAAQHTELQCKDQQACLAGFGFTGDATSSGGCIACKAGTIQPKPNHFDKCFDESESTTLEYSNEKTCNGVGIVSFDATSGSALCSGCSDPALGIGEWCQFSNAATCKNYGVVSADGVCTWDKEADGTIAVSDCKPGYYFNPNPATSPSEDAILAGANGCFPCSPGTYASDFARRVECDACSALQTSEPASTSASDCFSKFESAPPDHTFCYGVGGTSGKPLSRITSRDDCSASAESLGFRFDGEFMVPYVGCVYDEKNQAARFYVDAASADGSRVRHDNLICEAYVCKDPGNDVIPLAKETADPFDVDEFPSCRVSDAQTSADLETEKEKNRKTFVPAMLSIGGATLAGSYYYQYRTNLNFDWKDVWMHIHVWLIFLRVVDMMSDFGFYAISLRGAFLEKYGDGDPETNPYEEPKVAAFLFASVFFTTLGLFLMPLDLWVLGQRSAGDVLGLFSILVMIAISLFEDCPQIILVLIYMKTMKGTGATDAVAVLSLMVSIVSVLFSGGTVFTHLNKLRDQNPTGWWRISVFESEEEVTKLRKENASFRASFKRSGFASAAQTSNPLFAVDANSSEYIEVQETLESQPSKSTSSRKKARQEEFGGFEDTATADELCGAGKKAGKECTRAKAAKSAYCKKHTCKQKKCHRLKATKADYCKQHVGVN